MRPWATRRKTLLANVAKMTSDGGRPAGFDRTPPKSVNKKDALLEAAKELFGECGYAETTFKKISERAGVAQGLLAHHYGNKEKLFLASGLDVLEKFYARLCLAIEGTPSGFAGVMEFCRAYLDFSADKNSSWLVLVRCSPYSDMKTKTDRDLMDSRFAKIHELLAREIERGRKDGTVRVSDVKGLGRVIVSLLVGVNRTRVLTPYASANLYPDALEFVERAITPPGKHDSI